MKRFKIVHQTIYEYPETVQLQTHTLRLRPREGHDQFIESFELKINPEACLKWHRDVESNSVAIATFSESTQRLFIESKSIVQKYDVVPHDFLIESYAVSYPFSYLTDDGRTLAPYLRRGDSSCNTALKNWIRVIWCENEPIQTFELLLLLNQQIYQSIGYIKRDEEGVQSTNATLTSRKGSCRDLANLFIDAARHLGLAARFVSGYIHEKSRDATPGTTHAWVEIFIPGAGWKGFDPTHGGLVGAEHIAVAVSRLPELVPSVEGSFWGRPGANLKVHVWVSEVC
ncbi:transglutaminase family protein [Alteromonas sp. ASW11-36]|uniref:Transglutaminase family protein n=1 Tax=Alteromonas arenosi TaxID=3055817 RepID=A0ABT7STD7_9ALTE|nr:transglutaminase family protein [Alteromonas sp. ASW11-36]MDM7859415.1 transglutaminase family protein [Alteromonas sp. ASW11-36]